jgi:hypothetical protein
MFPHLCKKEAFKNVGVKKFHYVRTFKLQKNMQKKPPSLHLLLRCQNLLLLLFLLPKWILKNKIK